MSPARKPIWEPKRRMILEEPGKPLLYDADRGLVADVSAKYDVRALVERLLGKDEASIKDAFEKFGQGLTQLTMELADTKYMDRTGELIEKAFRQTGISFPHRFQRCVELAILASRPLDKWTVTKATTRELVLQVVTCAVHQAMQEAGMSLEGLPCQAICFASFRVAANKTGDPVKIEQTKTLPKDNLCEFVFSV